jgi:NAD(P)-dependent dehydrogenase (short-subunit alcohol dehydrogenase family)
MIRLDGQVAIVTGAGGGLGRSHALLLAKRGAKVVVNDMGAGAEEVVAEIKAAGGEAIAAIGSVTDEAFINATVKSVVELWGRIDILVNNAGILRDKSFAKMDLDDFRLILDVHVMGSVIPTKAVWEIMRQQNYGRIVMTTSSSGLFGNFGQSNYGAAKMAVVGFMQTLSLEGEKNNIRVNALAPTAATQMLAGLLPEAVLAEIKPEYVSPALIPLVTADAPTRTILCAGAKSYEAAKVIMTQGIHIAEDVDAIPDLLVERLDQVLDATDALSPVQGFDQSKLELAKAGFGANS